jgi:hypothetical protein
MFWGVRAALRRRNRRVAVLITVVLVAAGVTAAHSSVADDHMGEAAAMCVAVLATGATAAALPALRQWPPRAPRPLDIAVPAVVAAAAAEPPTRARGDPALLQVFRR